LPEIQSLYRKYGWFTIILVLFILAKLPAMQLPYFWDELGVYSRAGLYLHDNGLGLLPKNLPPELSRGHPLLFSFIHGCGYFIFGDGVVGGHITGLIIALFLLLSIYKIAYYHFDQKTALLSVMLVIVQPVFFAQSILVLPEICLALFMLWAIHYWSIRQYGWYALMSTAAILIKETAIIIPVVVISASIINWLVQRPRKNMGFQWKQLLVLTPFLIFGLFLIIQRQQNGWYLFPLHGDNVDFKIKKIVEFGIDFMSFTFIEQGRIVLLVAGLIVTILILYKKLWHYHRFIVYLIMLFVGGILFSSLNFFMNRYLVFAIIPLIMVFAHLLITAVATYRWLYVFVPLVFFAGMISMYGYELYPVSDETMSMEAKFHYDEDMSYIYFLDAQIEAVNFVNEKANNTTQFFVNFPLVFAFNEPRFGFPVSKTKAIIQVKTKQKGFEYAVISNPGSYDFKLPGGDSLRLVKMIKNDVVEIPIYEPNFEW